MASEKEEITRSDAMSGMEADGLENTEPHKDHLYIAAALEAVELDGRKSYFKLRKEWSCYISRWINLLIIMNFGLVILTGLKCLDYKEYKWLITSVTVESFLQIVGMGYIAVKYLFSDEKNKPESSPIKRITSDET